MKIGFLIAITIIILMLVLLLKSPDFENELMQEKNDSLQNRNQHLELHIQVLNKDLIRFQNLVAQQQRLRKRLQNEKDKSLSNMDNYTDDELYLFFSRFNARHSEN